MSKKEKPSRPCTCHDITWGLQGSPSKGYQCLNCGAQADHSWNIRHGEQPTSPSTAPRKIIHISYLTEREGQ